jgi:hypothetical protein
MQRLSFLLIAFLSFFALESCKDVRLGADGVDASGGIGRGGGGGGAAGAGGMTSSAAGTTATGGATSSPGGTTSSTGGTTVTTLATGLNSPSSLVVDATSVYFINEGTAANNYVDPALMKVPTGGGKATTVVSVQWTPSGLAIAGTNLYWTNYFASNTVMMVPISGGNPATLVSGQTGSRGPEGIAVDATNVYWANSTGSGTVMKLPLGGGTPITLASGLDFPGDIAVDATNVYWMNQGTSGRADGYARLMTVPIKGGTPTTLASADGMASGGVAVDATSVYWVYYIYYSDNAAPGDNPTPYGGTAGCAGTVLKIPVGGGTPITLASGQFCSGGQVAVDATAVYWVNGGLQANGYTDGAVMALPLAGGTPIAVAAMQNTNGGLAIDATSVYWTIGGTADGDGAVLKAPKIAFGGTGGTGGASGGTTGTGGANGAGGSAGTSLTDNVALQELLANWRVTEVRVRGDEIWFNLAALCTDCQLPPYSSRIPLTYKLVVLSNKGIKSFVLGGENGLRALTVDSQQRVFAIKFGPDVDEGVVELSSLTSGTQFLQDIPLLFPTQGALDLAIDSESNLWLVTLQGLQKWNGTNSILYDTSNSALPTSEVHGLAIDKHDAKWVGLGLANGKATGLMKILGDNWQYIPYSSISALASADYASVECVDKDNNLWVSPSNWGNGPSMVRYDGTNWIAEDANTVYCDSSGTAWNVKVSFNPTPTGSPDSLDVVNGVASWDRGTWRSVDVSSITRSILSLDVYRTTLILGTLKGVAFVDGIGTGGAGGASGTGGTTGAAGGANGGANGGATGTGGANGGSTGANGGTTSSLDAGGANSCQNPLPLRCGDRLNHSTLVQGRPNVWVGYDASQRWESGPETIYAFQTPATCQVVARLKNLTVDLDLFFMTSCDPKSATECSSTPLDLQTIETVGFTSQPGQPYFVVVDGYNGAAGSYTLEVDCTCNQDAGAVDAPPADAQGDAGIAPGCDLTVASNAMSAFGLITSGSVQTSNATLPAVLATDANWGLKADVCRQAGYDITPLAGKTICSVSQDMTQLCQGLPAGVTVLMNSGSVACIYKHIRTGVMIAPGIWSATDPSCTEPTIAAGATVLCEGSSCTSATGPCCPTTNFMDVVPRCSALCQSPTITCDGPEDCSNGAVCCSVESTAAGFGSASCVSPPECLTPNTRMICHQDADCPSPQHCGVPNPMPAYVSPYSYPEPVYWQVGFQVCAP